VINNPIFIIGTERSGTNLLRLMLNIHENIYVPHPPHILKNFTPLLKHYGDLSSEENFMNLLTDVVKSIRLHPYKWEFDIEIKNIRKKVQEKSLFGIFSAIYEDALKHKDKKRYCCKSTFMIHHVDEILQIYPNAQFIFMIRDGRDVAVSAKKSIFNHFHPYFTAKLWSKESKVGLSLIKNLSEKQISLVKYEDLTKDSSKVLQEICIFLNEPFSEKLIEFHKTKEAELSGSLSPSWENTKKPVLKTNYNKFKKELSQEEIDIFESISKDELQKFNYQLVSKNKNEIIYNYTYYKAFEILNMINVQITHFIHGKKNILRYKKYWFLKSRKWFVHGK